MPENKIRKKEPYLYAGQVTLAANSNGQIIFQVASNFNYWMTRFSYKSYVVNSANAITTFDIQILKNEHAIMYDYMPNELFAGMMTEQSTAPDTRYQTGMANWFKFDKPYMFEAKSNIIINLRETAGIANSIVRIGLSGYKDIYFF